MSKFYGIIALCEVSTCPGYTKSVSQIVTHRSPLQLIVTILTISIVAPLVDETLFRGFLLRGVLAKYGPVVAILATALLTAVFHTQEPFKLVHSFLMGVLFASAVLWTNSVSTSFLLHSLHNSLALF